jgi:GNAT superfamily N-acetyltransferase
MDFFVRRAGRPSDHAFILESWQAAHSLSVIGREMGPRYISEIKELIRDILARPSTETRVAVAPDDDDAIFGYAVVGHIDTLLPRVYFTYVKQESRNLGVASSLLADLKGRQVVYTHKPARTLADKIPKPNNWIFSYFRNWES